MTHAAFIARKVLTDCIVEILLLRGFYDEMNVQNNILLRLFMVSGLPSRFFSKTTLLMKEFCMWITDSFHSVLPGFKMYSE